MFYWIVNDTQKYVEPFNCVQKNSFKNVINKMCLQIIYQVYTYKKNLALNKQEGLICHKNEIK